MLFRLSFSKACGSHYISARFLRHAAEIFTSCITHCVNLSIEKNISPSDLKLCTLIPFNKKERKPDHGNYRPVSLLRTVSEIIEKIICNQIYDYSPHDLLSELSFYGTAMLDLPKTLDTVEEAISLSKPDSHQ